MKMYNILYVLAIISKGIDMLYTHVHSDIVGIDASVIFENFQGQGVKGHALWGPQKERNLGHLKKSSSNELAF